MKQKNKKRLKILFIILLLFTLIVGATSSFATDEGDTTQVEETEETEESGPNALDIITGILDGILGIFLNVLNIIPVTIGGIIQMASASIANIGNTGTPFAFLQLDDILFNRVPILSVNFFSSGGGDVIVRIRESIATWYYALRNIAIVLSLAVLIYVGIRMAISTLAEDKAKYKKMLIDWVVGFITIFLLHYIIVIAVNVNDLLVGIFNNSTEVSDMGSFAGDLALNAVNLFGGFIKGFTSSILYIFITVLTMMFLFNYIKRMLTVAFLMIIAPIITVTYSIDKMGDGKSQALNTWLKEFLYNILIQPFHCIIYLAFMSIIIGLIGKPSDINWFDGTGLGASVIAIIAMLFIKQAEPIVRKIFGFDNASSLGSVIASGALLANSINIAKSAANKDGKDKKSNKSGSGGNASKPQPSSNANRNTSNIENNGNGSNSNNNSGNGQDANSQNGNQNENQRGNQNEDSSNNNTHDGSPSGNNTQDGNSGNNNGGNSNDGFSGDNDSNDGTQESEARNLNTEKIKREKKSAKDIAKSIGRGYGKAARVYSNVASRVAGMAIGAMASENAITGGITGFHAGKLISKGKDGVASGGKMVIKSATRKTKLKKETNQLIDKYNAVKQSTGWSDATMYNASKQYLNINNLDRETNPELRDYASTLHQYREQFEGRFTQPTDMVLSAINQIQTGELTKDKDSMRRYTRKK